METVTQLNTKSVSFDSPFHTDDRLEGSYGPVYLCEEPSIVFGSHGEDICAAIAIGYGRTEYVVTWEINDGRVNWDDYTIENI